jgi:hypothetical protein
VSKIENAISKSIFIFMIYEQRPDRFDQVPFQIYNKYVNFQHKH